MFDPHFEFRSMSFLRHQRCVLIWVATSPPNLVWISRCHLFSKFNWAQNATLNCYNCALSKNQICSISDSLQLSVTILNKTIFTVLYVHSGPIYTMFWTNIVLILLIILLILQLFQLAFYFHVDKALHTFVQYNRCLHTLSQPSSLKFDLPPFWISVNGNFFDVSDAFYIQLAIWPPNLVWSGRICITAVAILTSGFDFLTFEPAKSQMRSTSDSQHSRQFLWGLVR